MSKYIRKFESFKKNRYNSVNEELLGGIINFFKNMWNKAMEELKKLGPDPDAEEVSTWIADNPFNPADNNYLFKNIIEEFKKQPQANDQACLQLIDNILNPETGVLGKQGLQPLFDNLDKAYKDEPATPQMVRFCLEIVRNKAIKQYKYAGGPDLKIGEAKIDPKKITLDLKDMNHLPDLKKLLTAATDDKKKKDATLIWTEKTLLVQIDKYADEIKQEDVDAYLKSKGIEAPEGGPEGGYKVGDNVVYKREKFDQAKWDALTDDDKKKPNEGKMKELQAEAIGIKKISKIEGDKVSFEGADFTKTMDDILMKTEEARAEGQEDLVKTLGDVKAKNPDAIKKISDVANLYKDPDANKDKIAEIEKQLGGGEEGK
jgi:hypothetical protein